MQNGGVEELLGQLRAAAALAAGKPAGAGPTRQEAAASADFAAALKTALDQVNNSQQRALALARDYETGAGKVALHEVMLSMQKANIAFQATVQARNRLVTAYQDIMNMPI
jgi:flagellar hook-basal body complex protein FliE